MGPGPTKMAAPMMMQAPATLSLHVTNVNIVQLGACAAVVSITS